MLNILDVIVAVFSWESEKLGLPPRDQFRKKV